MVRVSRWIAGAGLAMGCVVGIVLAGDITPPTGPVAGTMKTLVQVEPRVEINAVNTPGDADSTYRITQPGSYYLTGNLLGEDLKRGIEIASDDVTIDLMGFTMRGNPNTLQGIAPQGSPRANITIRNGVVRDWGSSGIDLTLLGFDFSSRIENVIASNNASHGIRAGGASVITGCVADLNGGNGIESAGLSAIENCHGRFNGGDGIVGGSGATVRGCSATDNVGDGIRVQAGSMVVECASYSNTGVGIYLTGGSSVVSSAVYSNEDGGVRGGITSNVLDNSIFANGSHGVTLQRNSIARGNTISDNPGAAIHVPASTGDCRIESNNVASNSVGIEVLGSGNLIFDNTASGNGTNYIFAINNWHGGVIDKTAVGSPPVSGNSATSVSSTTDPRANYAY